MKRTIMTVVALAAIVAGVIFWWGNLNDANAPGVDQQSLRSTDAAEPKVKDLVEYSLPAGWQEGACPDGSDRVYIVPAGAVLDCKGDPKAPVNLMVDPRDTKDCQHVTAPNGVLSHVCKSLFIDGHKTIQASTEYPKSDLYPKAETVADYFVDTGKGVVKIEYTYGAKGTNSYQIGFDQLALSVKVR